MRLTSASHVSQQHMLKAAIGYLQSSLRESAARLDLWHWLVLCLGHMLSAEVYERLQTAMQFCLPQLDVLSREGPCT